MQESPGQLQTECEYIHNKMKKEVDFLSRSTKVNLWHHVKVKLRDKSYQDLDHDIRNVSTVKDIIPHHFIGKVKTKKLGAFSFFDSMLDTLSPCKYVPQCSDIAKYKEEVWPYSYSYSCTWIMKMKENLLVQYLLFGKRIWERRNEKP